MRDQRKRVGERPDRRADARQTVSRAPLDRRAPREPRHEPGQLLGQQPRCVLRPIAENREHHEAERDGRDPLEQEEPLPAARPRSSISRARRDRLHDAGHRVAMKSATARARSAAGTSRSGKAIPEEARSATPSRKRSAWKAVRRAEHHAGRDHAPADHDPGDPPARPTRSRSGCSELEEEVAEEEDRRRAVDGVAEGGRPSCSAAKPTFRG
jgi:hypothetical protein